MEATLAALLGGSVAIYPDGWASIAPECWRRAPRDLARRALVRVLLAVGGGAYPPRGERLDPVLDDLLKDGLGRGRTLAGCRLVPHGPTVVVAREVARARPHCDIAGAGQYSLDDRFIVTVTGRETPQTGLRLAALGEAGWREVVAARPALRESAPPHAVRLSLPALFDLEGVRHVPHLMYGRRGADPVSVTIVSAMFRPRHALAGPGFAQS
jgi:tRNA(Ile)-lysidine synthase